jgi:hypothetical protein
MMTKAEKAKLREVTQDRARMKRKLRIAMQTLDDLAHGFCCHSCEPGDPRCPVGEAKEALDRIKEVDG